MLSVDTTRYKQILACINSEALPIVAIIMPRFFFFCDYLFSIIHIQDKYEKAMASLAEMEKRVVMAESMLEATLQYESGQVKAMSSPGYKRFLKEYLMFYALD